MMMLVVPWSHLHCALALQVVDGNGKALPAALKLKLRRVSALESTLVEWVARLPRGASPSDMEGAPSRYTCSLKAKSSIRWLAH